MDKMLANIVWSSAGQVADIPIIIIMLIMSLISLIAIMSLMCIIAFYITYVTIISLCLFILNILLILHLFIARFYVCDYPGVEDDDWLLGADKEFTCFEWCSCGSCWNTIKVFIILVIVIIRIMLIVCIMHIIFLNNFLKAKGSYYITYIVYITYIYYTHYTNISIICAGLYRYRNCWSRLAGKACSHCLNFWWIGW